ncbi:MULTISPECIES: RhoGEF domain-containing protein [Legionella]|uniref:RhoGEF domain protein n=1 Tax=Legionella drozanskii LLAP-1 TaxID=1212489 RepID=A0A0W0SXA4_9GAMM|nr:MULTISPECIES: RhoGEF domain-containing protein [Legionella]KTC87573.1 RhoGEF domain protein [Legionella drozanskii LLAP-1]PJE11399.1 MAG: hypothetical protein CK430_09005 [Legionella sp.]
MLASEQIKEMIEKEKELDTTTSSSQSSIESSHEQLNQDLPQRNLSQNRVIQEIIDTERTFYRSLDILDNYFSSYGKTAKHNDFLIKLRGLLPQLKDVSTKLLQNVTESIRTDLDPSELAKLRQQRTQLIKVFFTIYPIYSELYPTYLKEVREHPEAFKDIELYLADPKANAKQSDLASILIQIIQRGPRYQLLVIAIIKLNNDLTPEDPSRLTFEEIQRIEELLILIKGSIEKVNSELPVLDLKSELESKKGYQFGDFLLRPAYEYLTQEVELDETSTSSTSAPVQSYRPGDLLLRPLYAYLTQEPTDSSKKEKEEPVEKNQSTSSTNSDWGFSRFWSSSKTAAGQSTKPKDSSDFDEQAPQKSGNNDDQKPDDNNEGFTLV